MRRGFLEVVEEIGGYFGNEGVTDLRISGFFVEMTWRRGCAVGVRNPEAGLFDSRFETGVRLCGSTGPWPRLRAADRAADSKLRIMMRLCSVTTLHSSSRKRRVEWWWRRPSTFRAQ